METALTPLIDKLRQLKSGLYDMAMEVIVENEDKIAELNAEQMNAGINAQGEDIEPAYTPSTRRRKAAKGQPFDRVTLKDTGKFHRRIKVKREERKFAMINDDEKAPKLLRKYGDVLGLTEESQEIVKENILLPGLMLKIDRFLSE